MKYIILAVVAWVASGIVAAGIYNADFRGSVPDLIQSPWWAVETRREALVQGLVGGPISLIVNTVMSGFLQYGWTLSAQPAKCTKNPEIWCR